MFRPWFRCDSFFFYSWHCKGLMMLILCDVLFSSWTLIDKWFDETKSLDDYSADLCLTNTKQMDIESRDAGTSVPSALEHCFSSAQPCKPYEKNGLKTKQTTLLAVLSSSAPNLMQICLWTISFGSYMSVVYFKPLRLLLFLPGRTPFQQDESGVIDLAGGRMAGSMLAYVSVGVYLCEWNFT